MDKVNSPPSSLSIDDPIEKEKNLIPSELSSEGQLKLEVIQTLLEPCGLALRVPSAAQNLWSTTGSSSRKTR